MKINYSQEEIDNIIETLLSEHRSKLKSVEIAWLECLKDCEQINQATRDILISLYDRVGEAGY